MKRQHYSFIFIWLFTYQLHAQSVGINTNTIETSAILDISSSNKGVLIPRLTAAEMNAILNPADGLLVYRKDVNDFYYFDNTIWKPISESLTQTIDTFQIDAGIISLSLSDDNQPKKQIDIGLQSGDNLGNHIATQNIIVGEGLAITDADENTQIFVEQTANDDKITLAMQGTEYFTFNEALIETKNNGRSVFLGEGAGSSDNLTNNENVFIGYHAGVNNVGGASNIGIGLSALSSNQFGFGNIGMGNRSLRSNTSGFFNVGVGIDALELNTNGQLNVAIGGQSLRFNTLGNKNTALGVLTLGNNIDGTNNVAVGYSAMLNNSSGGENVAIGANSLLDVTSGSTNIAIGFGSGNGTNGTNNVFIGQNAGEDITGSDQLFIESTPNYTIPLIYGNFNQDRVGINRVATSNTLEVGGNASKSTPGSWLGNSDLRLKKNVQQLNAETMLQKLLALNGVSYEWNDDTTGVTRPLGAMMGFIAQDIQTVFPEKVSVDAEGYLQTAYGDYDPMFVEAIRALYVRIKDMEAEIEELKSRL